MAFTLQGFGPFLHWMTLVILCVLPVILGFVLYKLGRLPGAIAAARGHPQAVAINDCGWMGLVTLVLWPIAMVWAHLGRGSTEERSPAAQGSRSVVGELQQASQRPAQSSDRASIGRGRSPVRVLHPDVDEQLSSANARFAVRIRLDNAEGLRLPAGAQGDAVVYSGKVQVAGVIRMAVVRMTSWTNYLYLTS